ncbi:MAG: thymidine phosphorylase [Deltaproteobacteria bacterium]|nr:thymidine phosphorylase [Deltaproteobacteria bacterium]
MFAPELLAKKRDGHALDDNEIRDLFAAYMAGDVADYQMSALLMAICCKGFDARETATLADVMLCSGTIVDLTKIAGRKVDKHSTGGVGDKVSLSLAPLVAACGVRVPMVSGRGLGHTGGTLDKLESCPGFNVGLDLDRYQQLVRDIGCALIGQTREIAPLDKRLYALRDVTGTVESIPLIACSIMSKKLAEGIDALVLDIKTGRGAFMRDREKARELGKLMVAIGARANKRVVAVLTQMDQPLGAAVGNALEWREATAMLRGDGPADYKACVYALAGEMLVLGEVARDQDAATRLLDDAVKSGRALSKWREIIKAQGGDVSYVDAPERLHPAEAIVPFTALKKGIVHGIDTRGVGLLSVRMGAGRTRLEDKVDPAVGLVIDKKIGDRVESGEALGYIHARAKPAANAFAEEARALYEIGDGAVSPPPLVLERIAT